MLWNVIGKPPVVQRKGRGWIEAMRRDSDCSNSDLDAEGAGEDVGAGLDRQVRGQGDGEVESLRRRIAEPDRRDRERSIDFDQQGGGGRFDSRKSEG
jgi:hypothetical protein